MKISGYRSSVKGFPYDDVAPLARGYIDANPDRCVWGSDWPHPSLFGDTHMPDDGQLLDMLGRVGADGRIAAQDPGGQSGRLYGFAS